MKWYITNKDTKKNYENYGSSYSDVFTRVLINRDINKKEAANLIANPKQLLRDPVDSIPGIEEVATVIADAIIDERPIYIFADYDVDGMTSGYVMTSYLDYLGADVTPYYPERVQGYGLSVSFANQLIKFYKKENKRPLVITVDNGITAVEPVKLLKENNIDVVITDHHLPGAMLPDCPIANPWLKDDAIQNKARYLCGCAVAWKTAIVVERILNQKQHTKHNYSHLFLPYVAIGTISDVMPLLPENRAIIKLGLNAIGSVKNSALGLLLESVGFNTLSAKDIAWSVAPKLNSCSRLGNTRLAAFSFYQNEKEENTKALEQINAYDKERKKLTDEAMEQVAKQDYTNSAVCLYDLSNTAQGIAGVVAGKMAELFNKPAVVYHKTIDSNTATASCRGGYIDIKYLLSKAAKENLIVSAAGHSLACGATLYINKIKELDSFLTKLVKEEIKKGTLVIQEPSITIDDMLTLNDITSKLYGEMRRIPYNGDEPMFCFENVKVEEIQSFKNPEHLVLKCTDDLGKTVYALAWYGKSMYTNINSPKYVHIAGSIEQVGFAAKSLGLTFLDLIISIKDIKPATEILD